MSFISRVFWGFIYFLLTVTGLMGTKKNPNRDDPKHVVQLIIDLWKFMGSVSGEDMKKLVYEHNERLNTEDLKTLT